MALGAKPDPYNLDYADLRKQYVNDTTYKLPFVKSSFIHYTGCPRSLKIDGVEYKNELALTMELVQAPTQLTNMMLTDPKEAKKQEIARRKKEAADKK